VRQTIKSRANHLEIAAIDVPSFALSRGPTWLPRIEILASPPKGSQPLFISAPRTLEASPPNLRPLLAIVGPAPQVPAMTQSIEDAGGFSPDGAYSFTRLALSLLISSLIGAGMWAIIVVMPEAQRDFGVDRSAVSLPYTVMMCTLAFSTVALVPLHRGFDSFELNGGLGGPRARPEA
jgi:hypothetical protein